MNFCWWGGVKMIFLYIIVNDTVYDFHCNPSTNIHWNFNDRRFCSNSVGPWLTRYKMFEYGFDFAELFVRKVRSFTLSNSTLKLDFCSYSITMFHHILLVTDYLFYSYQRPGQKYALTSWGQWHRGVWLSGVNDTAEIFVHANISELHAKILQHMKSGSES